MRKLSAHGTCSALEKKSIDFTFESNDQKEKWDLFLHSSWQQKEV